MDILRMRCPNSEINAVFSSSLGRMRTQLFVNVIMRSLTEQILIQFTDPKNLLFRSCRLLCHSFFLCYFFYCRSLFCCFCLFCYCCFSCSFLRFFHNPLLLTHDLWQAFLAACRLRSIYAVRSFYLPKTAGPFFAPQSLWS